MDESNDIITSVIDVPDNDEIVPDNNELVLGNDLNSEFSTADYYDSYYERVLSKLDTISVKQDTLTEVTRDCSTYCFLSCFLIGIFFIYLFLRNMITLK